MYVKVEYPLVILPLGSKDTASQHYLKTIRILIFDYFTLLNKPTWENILKFRYENSETLEKVGARYGYTKERVRQILKVIKSHLQSLFKGNELKKPHCQCSPDIIQYIRDFTKNETFLRNDLLRVLEEKEQGYLDFIMKILGYTAQEHNGVKFFSKMDISGLCQKVEDYLEIETSPVTVEKLSQVCKRSVGSIQTVLTIIPIEERENKTYCLPSDHLRKMDRIYRYLKEKGKPVHYQELSKISGTASIIRLSNDGRFKSIGKSGLWGLAEWRMNTDTVRDLIDKTLKFLNRPADLSEIVQIIHLSRPDCLKRNIRSSIYAYRNKFTWVDDTVIALKQWGYPSKPYHSRKPIVIATREEFNKVLVEIMGDKILTSKEILEVLQQKFPKLKLNSLISRLYKTTLLKKIPTLPHELQKYQLVNNYEKMMKTPPKKSDRIRDIAVKILAERKEIPLSELISHLTAQGFKRISCYSALKRQDFFVKSPQEIDPRYRTIRLA